MAARPWKSSYSFDNEITSAHIPMPLCRQYPMPLTEFLSDLGGTEFGLRTPTEDISSFVHVFSSRRHIRHMGRGQGMYDTRRLALVWPY